MAKCDELTRLNSHIDDLMELSTDLSQSIGKENDFSFVPVRKISSTSNLKTSSVDTRQSLVSLVSVTELNECDTINQDHDGSLWRSRLVELANQEGTESVEQMKQLLSHYDSLESTIAIYRERLNQQSDTVHISEQVETKVELEEKAWEIRLQKQEQRVQELETELNLLKKENRQEMANEVEQDDPDTKENKALREVLALRMEEKRDIEAVKQSLLLRESRKRRHSLISEVVSERSSTVAALESEKEALQADIITMEAEREQKEAQQIELVRVKEALAASNVERQQELMQLEASKHDLRKLKEKLHHVVDVYALQEKSIEAVMLQLLYQHEGEMGVNELKQATITQLSTTSLLSGTTSSNSLVVRSLYALVANGLVQIDRSYASGIVTSLLL